MQNFLQLHTFVTKLADKVKKNQVDISSLREENASLRHELATIRLEFGTFEAATTGATPGGQESLTYPDLSSEPDYDDHPNTRTPCTSTISSKHALHAAAPSLLSDTFKTPVKPQTATVRKASAYVAAKKEELLVTLREHILKSFTFGEDMAPLKSCKSQLAMPPLPNSKCFSSSHFYWYSHNLDAQKTMEHYAATIENVQQTLNLNEEEVAEMNEALKKKLHGYAKTANAKAKMEKAEAPGKKRAAEEEIHRFEKKSISTDLDLDVPSPNLAAQGPPSTVFPAVFPVVSLSEPQEASKTATELPDVHSRTQKAKSRGAKKTDRAMEVVPLITLDDFKGKVVKVRFSHGYFILFAGLDYQLTCRLNRQGG